MHFDKMHNLIFFQETDHPPGNSRITFDKGINLLLDSYDYKGYKREVLPIRDYSRKDMLMPSVEDVYTVTDKSMNDFRLILHNKDEMPMFLGQTQESYILETRVGYIDGKLQTRSLENYDIPIEIKTYHMDDALQDKYSFYERGCRFNNELGSMKMFDTYSKVKYLDHKVCG